MYVCIYIYISVCNWRARRTTDNYYHYKYFNYRCTVLPTSRFDNAPVSKKGGLHKNKLVFFIFHPDRLAKVIIFLFRFSKGQ